MYRRREKEEGSNGTRGPRKAKRETNLKIAILTIYFRWARMLPVPQLGAIQVPPAFGIRVDRKYGATSTLHPRMAEGEYGNCLRTVLHVVVL